jgi:hypothetical protein
LEGINLVTELAAFGMKWASDHAAEVAEALEADRSERRMREGARSTFPEGQQRARAPGGTSKPKPPSFEKIATIAGWALRPCGIVFDYPILDGLQPLPRTYFYATEDADLADGVLDALRQSGFRSPLGTGFGRGRRMFRGGLEGGFAEVLRFGKVRTADLKQTARVLIARSFEDFSERRDPYSQWVVPIANEATRIERLLVAEESENDRPRKVLPASQRAALLALESARKANPSQGIALKHLPDKIKEQGGKRLSPGRIPKLIESLRESGFPIPDARGDGGYRLERPLMALCSELGIEYPTA